ncbi:unnamed protein product [Rotaria sp. Silwood1]|nr:unnamed protein product [Rotaria sp. Silwood1]
MDIDQEDSSSSFFCNIIPDLGHILCDPSMNATVRSLARAAYGEKVSFNDLAPGEFDLLLGKMNKKIQ